MSVYDKLASELRSIITESDSKKPKPYDTDATVVRVEGDTLWVHIPGGVEETPIKKTINASPGDNIKVHIANGTAWISGNATAPPTDDATAIIADGKATDAQLQATVATNYANEAQLQADRAKKAADIVDDIVQGAIATADQAAIFANTAAEQARNANDSAAAANSSAESATYHLSEVEKVVDVLNWISQHGKYDVTNDDTVTEGKWYFKQVFSLTGDTEIVPNKDYYKLIDGQYIISTPVSNPHEEGFYELDGYVVDSPISNPHDEGFYELSSVDTAVTNYVTTHLYLIDGEGLYVRMDEDQGAQLKITGTGIYLLAPNGEVIAQYSDTVILGDSDGSHIELDPEYGLGFYQTTKEVDQQDKPTNRVAYIQSDRLFIQSATLTNNLQIGNFRWVVLDHRISLKYNPIQ